MSKLLNQVLLGKWCSKECGEHILKLKEQERDQYKEAHDVHKNSQVDDFIEQIKEAIDHLKQSGHEPTRYFKEGVEGESYGGG